MGKQTVKPNPVSSSSNNPVEQNFKLTKHHELFMEGKRLLEDYDEIAKKRELTPEERAKRHLVKLRLFNSVKKYVVSEMNGIISKYRIDSDTRIDLMAKIQNKFFSVLYKYNNNYTPTTFIKPYIFEVVTKYINESSQHLKTSEAANLKKINKAEKECEAMGIEYDDDLIKQRTGLSFSVIKKTRRRAEASINASITEASKLDSLELSPEEIAEKNEESEILHNIMQESLTPEEIQFYMTYLNVGGKQRTYKEMMSIYNKPEHEVKSILSNIGIKLKSNKDMLKLGKNNKFRIVLNLHDTTGNELEDSIIDALNDEDMQSDQ